MIDCANWSRKLAVWTKADLRNGNKNIANCRKDLLEQIRLLTITISKHTHWKLWYALFVSVVQFYTDAHHVKELRHLSLGCVHCLQITGMQFANFSRFGREYHWFVLRQPPTDRCNWALSLAHEGIYLSESPFKVPWNTRTLTGHRCSWPTALDRRGRSGHVSQSTRVRAGLLIPSEFCVAINWAVGIIAQMRWRALRSWVIIPDLKSLTLSRNLIQVHYECIQSWSSGGTLFLEVRL